MLNQNILQGKWNEFKGEALKVWGKLTDDDFDQAKGDITKFSGIVQKKFGETQESVREKINKFVSMTGNDTQKEVNKASDGVKKEVL